MTNSTRWPISVQSPSNSASSALAPIRWATGKFTGVGKDLHAARPLVAAPKSAAVEEFLPLALAGLSQCVWSRIFRTVFWADFFVVWLVVLLVARTFRCGQETIRHKRLPSRAARGPLPFIPFAS